MEHGSAEGHSNFQVFCRLGSRARAWGAKKKVTATFQNHGRGRMRLVKPFVNQMRRGNVHIKAIRKNFKNIYARFHTFYRMGASRTG